MKKFTGNKPLFIYRSRGYLQRLLLQYHNFEPPKSFDLYDLMDAKSLEEKPSNIVFGSKRVPEEFTNYSYLHSCEGPGLIFHERVLTVLQEICPHDFQAFPIIIKNANLKNPPFENKDYYILNLLHEIDALDEEESRLTFPDPSSKRFWMQRPVFKEYSMSEHHLGLLKGSLSHELISPFLANHLTKLNLTKGIQFLTEREAFPRALPEEWLQAYLNDKEYEAARRSFVSILNKSSEFADFKKYLHLLPRASVEKLIELALERSSHQKKECEELRTLLDQRKE